MHYHLSKRTTIRWIITLLIGGFSMWLAGLVHTTLEGYFLDVGWAINAARDLVIGQNPYRHTPSEWLIPYPLTTAIIMLPWSFLPGTLSLKLLYALTGGAIAYKLLEHDEYWRLLLFLSPSYVMACLYTQ